MHIIKSNQIKSKIVSITYLIVDDYLKYSDMSKGCTIFNVKKVKKEIAKIFKPLHSNCDDVNFFFTSFEGSWYKNIQTMKDRVQEQLGTFIIINYYAIAN